MTQPKVLKALGLLSCARYSQISQPNLKIMHKAFKSHKQRLGRGVLVIGMLLSWDRTGNN
jgi:hypothetical protein